MNTTHPTIATTKTGETHLLEDIRKIEDVMAASRTGME